MTHEEPVRWFFVHMQKTAGTTLSLRLSRQFPPDAVYPAPEEQRTPGASTDVDLLCQRFGQRRGNLRLVAGHFPLCTTELLGAPFRTFTVLRDPVERTLSSLRRNRERDPVFRGRPVEEIYADPVRFHCLIRNHMVKMLSLTPAEMTDGLLTPAELTLDHLDVAKHKLAEVIDVWGVQEDFEGFCARLTDRFGWNLGEPRFANRSEPLDVDDAFRARILEDNQLDVELYRFALDLLQAAPA